MNNTEVKYYEYYDKNKKCKAVKAVTTYAGKYISAVSYAHPNDTYDFEFGKKVAQKRLDIKLAHKRAASMRARAERYAMLIVEYKKEIKRMDKEMRKALTLVGDRLVDASTYEKELEDLLATIE
jgi:hypothetical protein